MTRTVGLVALMRGKHTGEPPVIEAKVNEFPVALFAVQANKQG